MTAAPTGKSRYVNPSRYELDRQLGVVTDPDAGARRHPATFADCNLGPCCPYPVRCCQVCGQHAPIGCVDR
jgi:hypothetical protein